MFTCNQCYISDAHKPITEDTCCSFLEPTQPSLKSDNVENDNGNVEVLHAAKTDDDQAEESANTDELLSAANSSEQYNTEQLFILNRNNQPQQPSTYKKMILPIAIHG